MCLHGRSPGHPRCLEKALLHPAGEREEGGQRVRQGGDLSPSLTGSWWVRLGPWQWVTIQVKKAEFLHPGDLHSRTLLA